MKWVVFMNEESQKRSTASQKFWDAFKACVEDSRVRPDRSIFYVKWGQAFVNFLPGKRLLDRSRQDIRKGVYSWLMFIASFNSSTRFLSFWSFQINTLILSTKLFTDCTWVLQIPRQFFQGYRTLLIKKAIPTKYH